MSWSVYVNGLFIAYFRRKSDAFAFKRDWLRHYPNDFVTIKHK